jgi:alginate regulatory protein algP
VTDRKSFSFVLDADGRVSQADFRTRTLRRVIEAEWGDDWKKSPKKLLRLMSRSPDVCTAVFEARTRMIPQYIARYEELHDKVRELSAQGLKAMELTDDGLPPHDDLRVVESEDIFETYAETRRDALRCHRALALMQKTTLTEWVECMDRAEFKVLCSEVKDALERGVEKTDGVYCPLKDSPEGPALVHLMQAAPAALKPVGLKRTVENGLVCAVVSDRKAFRAWCEENGCELADKRQASLSAAKKTAPAKAEEKPAAAAPEAESTPETEEKPAKAPAKEAKPAKAPAAVKTVKPAKTQETKPAKAPKAPQAKRVTPAPAADASEKAPAALVVPRLAVKVLKTEAKLATARPKVAAEAPKPSAAGDDLASRLVRSLQITPSAVTHRAPGRPKKTAEAKPAAETKPAPAAGSRPASRNKSGRR